MPKLSVPTVDTCVFCHCLATCILLHFTEIISCLFPTDSQCLLNWCMLMFPRETRIVECLVPADCGSSCKGTSFPLPRRNGESLSQDATSASRDPRRHLTQLFYQPAFRLQPLPQTQEGVCGPHEHPSCNQPHEGMSAKPPKALSPSTPPPY